MPATVLSRPIWEKKGFGSNSGLVSRKLARKLKMAIWKTDVAIKGTECVLVVEVLRKNLGSFSSGLLAAVAFIWPD